MRWRGRPEVICNSSRHQMPISGQWLAKKSRDDDVTSSRVVTLLPVWSVTFISATRCPVDQRESSFHWLIISSVQLGLRQLAIVAMTTNPRMWWLVEVLKIYCMQDATAKQSFCLFVYRVINYHGVFLHYTECFPQLLVVTFVIGCSFSSHATTSYNIIPSFNYNE